jgi:hypothetical protein
LAQVFPPATEPGDFGCARDRVTLAEKAAQYFAVLKFHRANAERCRDGIDEPAEGAAFGTARPLMISRVVGRSTCGLRSMNP